MINPKHELLVWGPIDGRIAYVCFSEVFARFSRMFPPGCPDTMGYFKDEKTWFICDYPDLRYHGEKLFNKYILDSKITNKYYKIWHKHVNILDSFQNKLINLDRLSDRDLFKLYRQWKDNYFDFWTFGCLPEFSNLGGEKALKDSLLKQSKDSFIELFEVLSAPEDLSFFQKEELDLLNLRLIKNKKIFEKKIESHQKKYSWLRNSYGHAEILPVSYFKEELSKYSLLEAKNKVKEIKDWPKKAKLKKKEFAKRYDLSKKTMKIAERLSFSIWWQDYRKKFIFIAIGYTELFLEEINRRYKISKQELYCYTLQDIDALLKDGIILKNPMKRREGFMEYYFKDNSLERFTQVKANKIIKPFLEKKVEKNIKEFKGIVVSRGRAKGIVKIILSPKNIEKMQQGDILVAPMTSPDFIIAMRKAAAIVTDEGGMTSHAAIVSRELKIPCIVGTKVATKVLKDGDLVEVDANNGKVIIIKKSDKK